MDNEIKAWLYDVLNAILEIKGFLSDSGVDFNYYQNDIRTKEPLSEILKSSAKQSIVF